MSYPEILDSAAAVLRLAAYTAKRVSPPPWTLLRGPDNGAGFLTSARQEIITDRLEDSPDAATDLPYLALVSPDLGLAIAAMLTDEATAYRAAVAGALKVWPDDETSRTDWLARQESVHAMNLARLIHEADVRTQAATR